MTIFSVRHITTYDYRRSVRFGEHHLMFRPRDSYDGGCWVANSPSIPSRAACGGYTTSLGTASLWCELRRAARCAPDAHLARPYPAGRADLQIKSTH